MKNLQELGSVIFKALLLVLLLTLGVGLVQWVTHQPAGTPVILQPAPTPGPVIVYFGGAVMQPGVYALPYGTRLGSGLDAAGGVTENANLDSLNLAAPLTDGMRVVVPTARPSLEADDPGRRTLVDSGELSFPLDINLADAAAFESLPEIGPVTAASIISYRESHGPFISIEAIMDVPGIGPKTFDAIKDLITVNP